MIHTKQDNKPKKAYTCRECDSTDVKEIRRRPGREYGIWITTKCGNCNNILCYKTKGDTP